MRKVEAFNEDYNHEPVKVMYGVEIWENDYDYDDNDVTAWVELARDGLQDDLFVGYKLEDAPEYVDIDWETSDNPPTIRGVYIMVESKDLDDLIYDDFNGATQITNDEDASKYLGVSLDEYKEIIEEVKKVALDEMESWAEYYAEREAEYEEPDYDPYDDYDPFMYEELDEGYPPYTHNLVYLPNMNFRGGIDEMIKALDRFDIDALEVKASNFGDVTYEDIREHRREILDKGWDIQPSYDTSIKGANEVFICRKIKKYNESLEEGKDMNKLTEAVDKNKLADFIKDAVEDLRNGGEATHFFDMGADNGLHLVIGRSGDDYIGIKLAVNVDDLQYDFDWDWYMPYDKETGDVWDTEMQIADEEDYDALAQDFIDEFNKMEDLDIDEDGAIIEHEEVVEESKKDCDDKDGKCESCDKKEPLKESVEDDLYVMYWIDEDHRDQGIADYFYDIADIEDGKEVVDRLIDFEDYACAELLSGEDVVLYGRDADDTWGDLDESCKKEEKCDGKGCNEEKPLTESADQDDIRSAVYDTLRISGIDMQDILCDLVDTALDKAKRGGDVWDACRAAVDEGMTNLADQWKAYQFYCDMGDDKDVMWESLTEDVFRVTSAILKNDDDEDDHDDEGRDDPMTGDNVWESLDNEVPMNEDELWESLNKLDDQPVADDVLDEVEDKRTIGDVLDVELEDDDTAFGGKSFAGEKVRDFIGEVDLKETDTIDELNKALKDCGIKPIK